MPEYARLISVILIIAFLVSLPLIQCRNASPERIQPRQNRSLKNLDYINMCIFRKTRLCDFLRVMDHGRFYEVKNDREMGKRGVSRFYSNW